MQPVISICTFRRSLTSIQSYIGARAENNSKIEADEGVDNKSGVERSENDVCYLGGQCTLFLSFFFSKEPFL